MRKFDLLTEVEQIKDIKTTNGKITSVKNSHFEKKGLRKFEAGQSHYFSFFGDISTEEFIAQSNITPSAGIPADFEQVGITEKTFNCESLSRLQSDSLERQTIELEAALDKFRDRFTFLGTYRLNRRTLHLQDDEGRTLQSNCVESNHWYRIKRNSSATTMDGYFWNCTTDLSPSYTVKCLSKILDGYDRKATFTPGKYPVLFAQQFDAEGSFLVMIKESLMADKYFENAGLFSGKLGSKCFSDQLSIVDANVNSNLGVFAPFDGEGLIRNNGRLPLIEKGVIKNLIADQRLAKKYKIAPTGNGIRDFKSAPRVDYNSVEILAGTNSTASLLRSIPQCVLVMMGGGGDFTDIGDYSQPVEFGYLLEHGEVVGKIPAFTVKSTVQKMFGDDLIAVASDNYFGSAASPSILMKMDVLIN